MEEGLIQEELLVATDKEASIEPNSDQQAFENTSLLPIKNKEETIQPTSLAVAKGHEKAVRSHQDNAISMGNHNIPSTSKSLRDYSLSVIESSVPVSQSANNPSLPPPSCFKLPSDSHNIPDICSTIVVPSLDAEMEAKIDDIARAISNDWEQVARKLGLDPHDVNCIRTEYPGHLHKQVVRMLDRWMMIKGKEANVDGLIEALEKCRLKLPADKVRKMFKVKGKASHDGDKTRTLPRDQKGQKGYAVDDNLRQGGGPFPEYVESIQTSVSKHAVQTMTSHAEENTQDNTQSIDDKTGNNDVVKDSETEEEPSPEDIESIQIASSNHAVQPMMHQAEENTRGNTQPIDDNVGSNDEVPDPEMEEKQSTEDVESIQTTVSKHVVQPVMHQIEATKSC